MATAQTVLPLIRTRKRRLVAPDKRKKATFSCDRCKLRKIACHRSSPTNPCDGCMKASSACETTIKRKKRIRGPIENIGLHYKCLLVLVKNMFPDVDVNNIDAIIDLGERQGILMPSRYGGTNEDEAKELRELSIVITSGKPLSAPSSAHSESGSDNNTVKKEELEGVHMPVVHAEKPFVLNQRLDIPHRDYIIIDPGGNSHCIGPLGAPRFLDTYMKIIGLKADIDLSKWSTFQKIAKGEMIISSNHEPIHQTDLQILHSERFPYFGAVGKEAAEHYVDVFFSKVHSRCLCFDEVLFRKSHDRFWSAMKAECRDKGLSNHLICSIYMVWIIGRLYDPTDLTVTVEESVIQQYLHVVKLCLSDILLTATLDGIRTVLLLSMYMDNRKRRETGYILIELAARQAVTLGLSRRSLTLCTSDEVRREEIKRTWWTVFMMEIGFSGQMGRSSCIQMEDVTADLPTCEGLAEGPIYRDVYNGTVELTKYLYDVLQYRKSLSKTSNILADDNACKALEIQRDLTATYESLNPSLHNLEDFQACKLVLHYRYHYYCLLLTLPFFLHVAITPLIIMTDSILALINQCTRLSIAVANLIDLSAKRNVLNGTILPDIFYAYHAVMGLVVACLMIKDNDYADCFEVSLDELEAALGKIKALHLSQLKLVGGTLHKISRYVDAFVAGYDYFKCRPTRPLHARRNIDHDRDDPLVLSVESSPHVSKVRTDDEFVMSVLDESNLGMDDMFLFPGRHGFGFGGEFSIGSLEFGDMLLADYGMLPFDAGMGEALFKVDGF